MTELSRFIRACYVYNLSDTEMYVNALLVRRLVQHTVQVYCVRNVMAHGDAREGK